MVQKKVALVGCGRILNKHLDALAENGERQLTGVCDRVADKAQAAGESAGVPLYRVDAMLKAVDCDLVAFDRLGQPRRGRCPGHANAREACPR